MLKMFSKCVQNVSTTLFSALQEIWEWCGNPKKWVLLAKHDPRIRYLTHAT